MIVFINFFAVLLFAEVLHMGLEVCIFLPLLFVLEVQKLTIKLEHSKNSFE